MSDIKLKPCPFCGNEAILEEHTTGFRVLCTEWDCNSGQIDTDWTKEKAIKIWNTRAA